jgi:hypothetical protein
MIKKPGLLLTLLFALMLILPGCGSTGNDQGEIPEQVPISGKIYSISDNRILVVEGLEDVNIPQVSWFEQGKRAVYFAVTEETLISSNGNVVGMDQLARGQSVEVFHEGFLAESYPEQGQALQINIIEATTAEQEIIDSGRIAAYVPGDLLEVKISGVPDEMPAKQFKLTDQADQLLQEQNMDEGTEIRFRYIPYAEMEGLIFDVEILSN